MIRTLEATGKTVEEARAKACAQLGVEADALNVSFEVLEMPQKTGFLGLKLIPAKVRVSVEEPDLAPVPEVEAQPAAAPVQPEAEQLPQEPVAAAERQPEQPEPEVQAQPEEPEQLAAVQPGSGAGGTAHRDRLEPQGWPLQWPI